MSMESMILLLSGAAGAAIIKMFDGIIQFILQRHAKKKDDGEEKETETEKRLNAIVAALQVIMVDRMHYIGKGHIAKGGISLSDKENVVDMYKAYKALGGNGHLTTIMNEIEKLPIVDD